MGALIGGNPTGLVRIVINEGPPDHQPKERQGAFGNQQHAPVPPAQDPSREWGGDNHRDGKTEHPVRVGARPFAAREPVREQYQHGGPHSTLRSSQQEAHRPKLLPSVHQSATHRTNTPHHQQHGNKPLGAPVLRQIPTRNLQHYVSPEENSRGCAGLRGVHVERLAHRRKSQRDVGPVDEGDRVHNEGDRKDVQPTLGFHALGRLVECCRVDWASRAAANFPRNQPVRRTCIRRGRISATTGLVQCAEKCAEKCGSNLC